MVITIKDGSIKVEVEGVKGVRCVELTQAIENLIGKVDKKYYKKEFYGNIKNKQNIYLNLYEGKTYF